MTSVFSSAEMRERDKIIEEKHRKQLEAANRKIENLKRILEDQDKQCFDLRNRAEQLAQSLGFSDVNEARRTIDLADFNVNFYQAFARVQNLENEIMVERTQKEGLRTRCQELEELLANERKRSAALEKGEQRTKQESRDMHKQYDALMDKSTRAQDLFKRDRRKFFALYNWLCLKPVDKDKTQGEELDYNKLRTQHTERRRAILQEFGSDLSSLLALDIPALDQKMQKAQEASLVADLHGAAGSELRPTATTTAVESPAPSRLSSARKPLFSIQPTIGPNREPVKTLKQTGPPKPPSTAHSSETEEDSQAPSQLFKAPLSPSKPQHPSPINSSVTGDSPAPSRLAPSPSVTPTSSPLSAIKFPKGFTYAPSRPATDATRRTYSITPFQPLLYQKSESENATDSPSHGPPRKKIRLSLGSPVRTPKPTETNLAPERRVCSTSRVVKNRTVRSDENTPLGKGQLIRTSGQMRLEDYTVYKGRGRYAKEDESATIKTINAMYTINTERNRGLHHQFDEVVRNKDDRMRMDAGDCNECREWYAAVGPMLRPTQGPIWRSPSTAPEKQCKRHARTTSKSHDPDFSSSPSERHRADIELHKKQISRHRQNWPRPRTPPGYWNIGFPDTQEVKEINEQAEKIHRKKLRQVEREAEQGKWIRK